MKRLRELFGSGDRARLLVCIIAAGLGLAAAMLLPLAFRSVPAPEEPEAAAGDKRQMFADYWLLGEDADGISVTRLEEPSAEDARRCSETMAALAARCINDQALETLTPSGSEYTLLRDRAGTPLRLCRMWLEARGDWQNWLDVCFDMDSGEVYYFYLSRECLANRAKYPSGGTLSASYIAATLEEDNGWTLRWLTDGSEGSTALFSTDSGSACYQIDCRAYDALIDVKLCCR